LRAERDACLLAVSNTRVRKATKTRQFAAAKTAAARSLRLRSGQALRRWLRMTFHCVGVAKIALRGHSRSQIKTRPQPKYFRFEVKFRISGRSAASERSDLDRTILDGEPRGAR
jgi:hypothetical protein